MPEDLVDSNLRIDYGKLKNLVLQAKSIETDKSLSNGTDKSGNGTDKSVPYLNGNFNILARIIANGGTFSNLVRTFPFDRVTRSENYISLLYFLGMITYSGTFRYSTPFLRIPNETIRRIVYEYMREILSNSYNFTIDIKYFYQMLDDMAYRGEYQPMFKFIAGEIKKNTSLRDFIKKNDNEAIVKLFYLKDLAMFDLYLVDSERELNKGYSDLLLNPFIAKYKDLKYAYLIEFKYIKRSVKMKDLKVEIPKNVEQAEQQLQQYAIDDKVKKSLHLPPYGEVELKKVVIVFHGWEIVYINEQ
jgi:hypothetical protein